MDEFWALLPRGMLAIAVAVILMSIYSKLVDRYVQTKKGEEYEMRKKERKEDPLKDYREAADVTGEIIMYFRNKKSFSKADLPELNRLCKLVSELDPSALDLISNSARKKLVEGFAKVKESMENDQEE